MMTEIAGNSVNIGKKKLRTSVFAPRMYGLN